MNKVWRYPGKTGGNMSRKQEIEKMAKVIISGAQPFEIIPSLAYDIAKKVSETGYRLPSTANPYPETITDEASGIEVKNELRKVWQEGNNASKANEEDDIREARIALSNAHGMGLISDEETEEERKKLEAKPSKANREVKAKI